MAKKKDTIKETIAKRWGISVESVRCVGCAYWGFNRGKLLRNDSSSCGDGTKKGYTSSYSYCKHFFPKERSNK